LQGLNLGAANLDNVDLSSTLVQGANFSKVTLGNVKSGSISGVPAALPEDWKLVNGYLVGNGANLVGAALANSDLTNANLQNTNLAGADLADATLSGVRSGGIRGIPSALPTGWTLIDGYLVGPGANLEYANMVNASLHDMNLAGVNFRFANLAISDLRNVDLSNAVLAGANLSGSDLQSANLTLANLSFSAVNGANFSNSNTTNLVASGVDWKNTTCADGQLGFNHYDDSCLDSLRSVIPQLNLAGMDLGSASLDDENFFGANLASTNLRRVTLVNVKSGSITGVPIALPKNWNLRSGYLVGPSANLSNVDLGGVDLSNTNLQGVNLAGSSLAGANLTGIKSGGLRGTPSSLPEDWSIIDGYLVGPGANLDHANFGGADLRDVNLVGASLRYADLSGADLESADLTNTVMTAADLRDARLVRANLTGANLNRANIDTADFLFATLNNVSDQYVDWRTARCGDGGLGSSHLVNSCLGPALTQAVATSAPVVSGLAKINTNKPNSVSTTGGAWIGVPIPTQTYQWYTCKNAVPAATGIIPSHCTKIAKATTKTLKVLSAYKGKYLSVSVKGTSVGTPATVILAKSTAKVS
jgi:uncharacterized protein YjbI with pentapeptide repeats